MEPVPFGSVDVGGLRWLPVQPVPPAWELRAGDALLLRLEWVAERGSLARARSAGGRWTLKRVGFLAPRITARAEGAAANVAVLTAHVSYHAIELADLPTYRLRRAGLAVPAWTLASESGREVAHLEPVGDGRALGGGAVVIPAAEAGRPELPLLLAVAWYFVVTAWREEFAFERLVELEQRVGAPGSEASGGRD